MALLNEKVAAEKDTLNKSKKTGDSKSNDGGSNAAMLKTLEKAAEDSIKKSTSTIFRDGEYEDVKRNSRLEADFSCKINIDGKETVYLGGKAESNKIVAAANPKNREEYHRETRKELRTEHNNITEKVTAGKRKTVSLEENASDNENTRSILSDAAADKRTNDATKGEVSSVFSDLSGSKEKENLAKAQSLRGILSRSEDRTAAEKAEEKNRIALSKREQVVEAADVKLKSIINRLESAPNIDTESDGFFEILRKKRFEEDEEILPTDDENDDFNIEINGLKPKGE